MGTQRQAVVSETLSAAARELGRLGGKARMKALTPERVREIAVKAGKASGKARRRKATA